MADFTVKVFQDEDNNDDVEASMVDVIGNQLKILSAEFDNLKTVGSGEAIHRTTKLTEVSSQQSSWTEAASNAVDTLFDALSYKLWEENLVVGQVGYNETPKATRDDVKLIFVFEEDGQMVVPVPSKKNIARGELNAPLKLPTAYDRLVSMGMAELLGQRLADAISNAASGELSTITTAQRDEIVITLGKVATELREEADGDVAIFNAQLGDYSVRQCAD